MHFHPTIFYRIFHRFWYQKNGKEFYRFLLNFSAFLEILSKTVKLQQNPYTTIPLCLFRLCNLTQINCSEAGSNWATLRTREEKKRKKRRLIHECYIHSGCAKETAEEWWVEEEVGEGANRSTLRLREEFGDGQ